MSTIRSQTLFLHRQIERLLQWEFGKAEAAIVMFRVIYDGKNPDTPWWVVFGEEYLVMWGKTAEGLLSFISLNENVDRIVEAFEKISIWEWEPKEAAES